MYGEGKEKKEVREERRIQHQQFEENRKRTLGKKSDSLRKKLTRKKEGEKLEKERRRDVREEKKTHIQTIRAMQGEKKKLLDRDEDEYEDQYYEHREYTYDNIEEARSAMKRGEIKSDEKHHENEIGNEKIDDLEKQRLAELHARYKPMANALTREDEERKAAKRADIRKGEDKKADMRAERQELLREDPWTKMGLQLETDKRRGPKRKR